MTHISINYYYIWLKFCLQLSEILINKYVRIMLIGENCVVFFCASPLKNGKKMAF